jgi:hypothetical protein
MDMRRCWCAFAIVDRNSYQRLTSASLERRAAVGMPAEIRIDLVTQPQTICFGITSHIEMLIYEQKVS